MCTCFLVLCIRTAEKTQLQTFDFCCAEEEQREGRLDEKCSATLEAAGALCGHASEKSKYCAKLFFFAAFGLRCDVAVVAAAPAAVVVAVAAAPGLSDFCGVGCCCACI